MNKKQARALERRAKRKAERTPAAPESSIERRTRLYERLLAVVKAESDAEAGVDALIMVLTAFAGSVAARTGADIMPELHKRIDAAAGVAELEARKAIGIVEELAPAPVIAPVPWWRRFGAWIMRGLR